MTDTLADIYILTISRRTQSEIRAADALLYALCLFVSNPDRESMSDLGKSIG